jgi:TolB-like protein/class 3 adenylate cyclase
MSATTRRLAAILAADVAGYSRLMAADEVGTLAALKAARREVVDPAIAEHRGRIVKTTGDGMLVEFASAVDAVNCAMAVQEMMTARGGAIAFRIGINVGDVIIDGDDIFGDGVNVAARVESECEPGSVYISANALEQVRNKTAFAFDDLGERSLKNIDRPVRIHAVRLASSPAVTMPDSGKPLPLPDKPSIAVLPFQNMSGDPEQEYFADGMVEDIITALSRFKSLFVIARNSSFTYKGKAVDIKQVGRELGVRFVLEGSVRKAGGRVRITGQLITAETGAHLWADRFDKALEDVFELQDEVTTSVVAAIIPRLDEASKEGLQRKPPEKWDAYDHFLRGKTLLDQSTADATNAAQAEFRKAIEIDGGFGLALAFAAWCTFRRRNVHRLAVSDEEIKAAVALANRATELAPHDDQALAYAAWVLLQLTDEYQRCGALTDQAIALNPNSSVSWLLRGWIRTFLEDYDTAFIAFERTVRLNPLDRLQARYAWFGNAVICLATDRFHEGAEWASKMLAQNSTDNSGLLMFIENAARAGRTAEAEKAAASYKVAHPDTRRVHVRQVYQRSGVSADFRAKIDDLMDRLGLPE